MQSPAVVGAILLASAVAPQAADTPMVRMIVNSANPAASVSRAEVVDFFMKKITRWHDGSAIVPVDQSAASPARRFFCRDVLHRSLGAMEDYWKAQVFSGRDVPPPVKPSDQEVVAFVAANPGAIGYVSLDGELPEAVRVVELAE